MIKNIVKDVMFLSQKSDLASKEDLYIATDLIDTLNNHKDTCVGMAANMIGYTKRMIVISTPLFPVVLINPVITKKSKMYKTKESCLSLIGERDCTRYEEIEVDYLDMNFNKQHMKYTGFIAEIIQHEMDHLEGVII